VPDALSRAPGAGYWWLRQFAFESWCYLYGGAAISAHVFGLYP